MPDGQQHRTLQIQSLSGSVTISRREQGQVDAIAQHEDALGLRTQIQHRRAQGAGHGDQRIGAAQHPAYPCTRHEVLRKLVDVRSARGDGHRLAEPCAQQNRGCAVRIHEMCIDEIEILLTLQSTHRRQRAERHEQGVEPARHLRHGEKSGMPNRHAVSLLRERDIGERCIVPEETLADPRGPWRRRHDAHLHLARLHQPTNAVLDENPVARLRRARVEIGEGQDPHARRRPAQATLLMRSGALDWEAPPFSRPSRKPSNISSDHNGAL